MNPEKKKIQIFGQRCSGTNFLEKLLQANFKDLEIINYYAFKHIWNAALTKPIKAGENIKIIIIVRDPYDWIRSVHREPHHCAQLLGLSFDDFIRAPWIAYHSANWNNYDREIRLKGLSEKKAIESFRDVMDCRNQKMELFADLKNEFEQVMVVNYEQLRDYTNLTLQNIKLTLGLTLNSDFTQIYSYKNSGRNFKKKRYVRLPKSTLAYMNDRINWENEKLFNYFRQDKVSGKILDYHRMQFLLKQWYYENLVK